ncbi:hypothetical protein [Marinicauda sp. Alg238-R41]|uniref:hypothetical protein n=1 Tax=Marinicauda sp. Alg238-R41 TaxID=2993447 RepID=UPI0022E8F41B|nr:hypothetical protein [Marinicauda sp. Alg238-R41]
MNNLDNAAFAPAFLDVLARFKADDITEAEASAETLALLNSWYTYPGTVAERLAGFLRSIEGFIVTDGVPSDAIGQNGQFALDEASGNLYGPKAADSWGSAILDLKGDSAYQVAVSEGFVGTEAEWLASLVGSQGLAATIEVGTVTTGAAGSSASVTNSGDENDAVFDFTIPRGDKGDAATITVGTITTGDAGTSATVTNAGTSAAAVLDFTIPKGDKGNTGDAATIAVGTVSTGAAGSSATVTNSGTSGAAVFDFEIPQGVAGEAATIAVGTVTTGAAGSSASVTNSGTANAAVFDIAIPKGDKGDAATIAIGTVTTGAAGSSASVTNSGTSAAAVFDITIPRGDTGATGSFANDFEGAWDSGTAYTGGEIVTHDGETWYAEAASTNVTPGTDGTKWSKLAAKGADGAGAGTVTSVGVTGTSGHGITSAGGPITSSGTITLSVDASALKSHISLDQVSNTSDADKPVSTAQQTALDDKVDEADLGAANGVATLDGDGKLNPDQIPDGIGGLKGVTVSGSGTLSAGESAIIDASGGTATRTLPATLVDGDQFVAKARGGSVQVPHGTHTIRYQGVAVAGDGVLIADGETLHLQADSTSTLEIM